jgi:hypothetical protein
LESQGNVTLANIIKLKGKKKKKSQIQKQIKKKKEIKPNIQQSGIHEQAIIYLFFAVRSPDRQKNNNIIIIQVSISPVHAGDRGAVPLTSKLCVHFHYLAVSSCL